MGNPKYLKIPPKKQITFRVEEDLYFKFVSYAEARGLNQTETGREVLNLFFKGKTVTNTYLNDVGGLQFKIPLDLDIKKECIENRTILNADNSSATIGDNTTLVKINQIPNNLDVISADGFTANKDGVLHCGIDFVFIPAVIKKPTTLMFNKLDIDLLDSLYIFYFEVKADNTTDVILINPVEAVNELSKVNNRIVADKLAEWVQVLEVEQNQINTEYRETMEHIHKGNKPISNKRDYEVLNTHFTILEMDLLQNDTIQLTIFKNDNISVAINEKKNKD